jgi:predicted GNAT family acetyltransferase
MIEHDSAGRRFVARLPEGEAFLAYAADGHGTLDLEHTVVPGEARGRGVGDSLVRAALGYAREHGLQVIPSCPFVRQWLADHPEERDVLVPGAAVD